MLLVVIVRYLSCCHPTRLVNHSTGMECHDPISALFWSWKSIFFVIFYVDWIIIRALCTVFGMVWTRNANIIILDRLFYAIYSNWDLNNKEESWPKWIKVGNIHIKDQNNIKMLPYSITRMSFCFSISFLRLNLWFFLSCLGDSTFVLRLERWKSKNVSTFPHFWQFGKVEKWKRFYFSTLLVVWKGGKVAYFGLAKFTFRRFW